MAGADDRVVRREVVFSGRVQGVGFRATTRSIARRFDVRGWVRNEADGTVRMSAEGTEAQLDSVMHALESHFAGFIQHMQVIEAPGRGLPPGFDIQR